MNLVILTGNLGSDPKPTSNGTATQISLATSETYTKKGATEKTTETTWHTIFFYGSTAETVTKFLKKGSKISVTGAYKSNKFKDDSGVEKTSYFVRGDNFEFLDSKGSKESSEGSVQENAAPQAPAYQAPVKPAAPAAKAPAAKPAAAAKKPLAATVPAAPAPVTHTDEDLNSYDDTDPTASDDLPF